MGSARPRVSFAYPIQLSLERRKERREEGGALGHCVDEDVFVGGVGAVADGAEAVEGGDAERGGEISVRAAADGAFAQGKIHLLRDGIGASEESSAHFAFERRAVEAAGYLEAGAPVKWT